MEELADDGKFAESRECMEKAKINEQQIELKKAHKIDKQSTGITHDNDDNKSQ